MAKKELTIAEKIAERKAQLVAQAQVRAEERRLAILDTSIGAQRELTSINLTTLDNHIDDLDIAIKGKVRPAFGYGPLTNKILQIVLTLQFASKDDRASINPEMYDLIPEQDRDAIISAMGKTPFFRDATVVTDIDGNTVVLEEAVIANAEKVNGVYEYTDYPEIHVLRSMVEVIGLNLGLLDMDLSVGLTDRDISKEWKRALNRALSDEKLSGAVNESTTATISYEE